jgi:hypothetical protein
VDEIAVRAVQLEHIEAGLMRPPRTLAPGLHEILDLMTFQRPLSLCAIALGATGCHASQSSMSDVR